MNSCRIGSLCSGYGGLDMGVTAVLGGSVAWHCETDPNASKILAWHWPDAPNLGDITAADFDAAEPVDVLTAGFPCQDVSIAGRMAGLTDGTRSGLWLHVARAIEALQPRLVVIENVPGLLSASAHSHVEPCPWCLGDGSAESAVRALGAVLGDLAGLGLDAEWASVRASEIGAAHRRERVFIAAWPTADTDRRIHTGHHPPGGLAGQTRPDESQTPRHGRHGASARPGPAAAADPAGVRQGFRGRDSGEAAGSGAPDLPVERADIDWGPYAEAVARWEGLAGPAPQPTDDRGRLNPAFAEWLMGLPTGHVTAVPGLSRGAQLKALGNGVVPPQAAAALRLLLDRIPPAHRIREPPGRAA